MLSSLRVLLIRNPGSYSYNGLARIYIPGINPGIYGSPSNQTILSIGSCTLGCDVDLNRGSKSDVVDETLTSVNTPLPAGVLAHLALQGIYAHNNEISLSGINGFAISSNKKQDLTVIADEAKKYKVPMYFVDEKYCLNEITPEGSFKPYLPENLVSFDPRLESNKIVSMTEQLKQFYDQYIAQRAEVMSDKSYKNFLQNAHLSEPVTNFVMEDSHSLAIKINPEYAKAYKKDDNKESQTPNAKKVISRDPYYALEANPVAQEEENWTQVNYD